MYMYTPKNALQYKEQNTYMYMYMYMYMYRVFPSLRVNVVGG